MAEAATEQQLSRFFCHKCNQEISPILPEYICPRCQSGFIEQLESSSSSDGADRDEEQREFNYFWEQALSPLLEMHTSGSSSSTSPGVRGRGGRVRHPAGGHNARPLDVILSNIMLQLSHNLAGQGMPMVVNLHGNPADYAWGRGGLDAIITQLLNQLDGAGPPPLARDKIDQIPTVKITQEQVDANLQCTVCMDDFKLDEPVRKLSCSHHFHDGCIVPWLELHGTCPICRLRLGEPEGSDSGTGNQAAPPAAPSANAGGGGGGSTSRTRRPTSPAQSPQRRRRRPDTPPPTRSTYDSLDDYD